MIDFDEVMKNIREAMESLDGEEVANVHNSICDTKIEYDEDSLWNVVSTEEI